MTFQPTFFRSGSRDVAEFRARILSLWIAARRQVHSATQENSCCPHSWRERSKFPRSLSVSARLDWRRVGVSVNFSRRFLRGRRNARKTSLQQRLQRESRDRIVERIVFSILIGSAIFRLLPQICISAEKKLVKATEKLD